MKRAYIKMNVLKDDKYATGYFRGGVYLDQICALCSYSDGITEMKFTTSGLSAYVKKPIAEVERLLEEAATNYPTTLDWCDITISESDFEPPADEVGATIKFNSSSPRI